MSRYTIVKLLYFVMNFLKRKKKGGGGGGGGREGDGVNLVRYCFAVATKQARR